MNISTGKGEYEDSIRPDDDSSLAGAPKLPDRFADESYKLFSKVQVTDPTAEEARQIRNKCLRRILPFLCIGYHLMYMDKQTVCDYPNFQAMEYFSVFLFFLSCKVPYSSSC
jgi:hypothetical protein